VEAALGAMRQSNREAAAILIARGAHAMTDVTGFGLIGHLGEMLAASGADAKLDLSRLPLYDGALALARAGIASTLLPENLALGRLVHGDTDAATRALLFDPQTSGGLLAGVPSARAEACVAALHAAGYAPAAIIGRVGQGGLAASQVGIELSGAF
jgi:selenide,water dikinase